MYLMRKNTDLVETMTMTSSIVIERGNNKENIVCNLGIRKKKNSGERCWWRAGGKLAVVVVRPENMITTTENSRGNENYIINVFY